MRISSWQNELDEFVPPPQINIPKLRLKSIELPDDLNLDLNVDKHAMGEDQTNRLRSMLDNLISERTSQEQSDLLTKDLNESDTINLDAPPILDSNRGGN